jgi:alpha-amylase
VLHDYTGHHPDIQTDSTGHATFTLSSNGFSSGQSYLCFSRAGIGGSPALARRSTTQTFFGARDLDIAAILNGEATISRVWAAQGTPITGHFRGQLAHWPAGGSVALELFGTDGAALASARLASAETVECRATVRQTGWQTFKATTAGLPRDSSVPFALTVTYTSTQDLAPV